MGNIIDYVKGVGNYSLDQVFFTHLDILALTEIAYLDYDNLLATNKEMTLKDLSLEYIKRHGFAGEMMSVITKPRIELLSYMGASKRYQFFKVTDFINEISNEMEKQFSALTYDFPLGHLVVFKGTDENLTGWKEDFQMTYMNEVPAQIAAHHYLEACLNRVDGDVWVAGHSKGGNMAIFSSSKLQEAERQRIRSILAFDAPGLHDSILESEGFLDVKDRIVSYIPQDSFVSVLLGEPVNAQVVKSKGVLLLQHDTFTWEISYLDFIHLDKQSALSLHTDKTLSEWLGKLSLEDKKEFTDLIFTIFLEADIHKFGDITSNTPHKLLQLLNGMASLTTEQKKMAARVILQFWGTQADLVRDYLPDSLRQTGGKVRRFIKQLAPKSKTRRIEGGKEVRHRN